MWHSWDTLEKHLKWKCLASGNHVYTYMFTVSVPAIMAYVSSLVSNPSLTYNVASSHIEPAIGLHFSLPLVHMCHCMCHSFCPGHLCFSLDNSRSTSSENLSHPWPHSWLCVSFCILIELYISLAKAVLSSHTHCIIIFFSPLDKCSPNFYHYPLQNFKISEHALSINVYDDYTFEYILNLLINIFLDKISLITIPTTDNPYIKFFQGIDYFFNYFFSLKTL